MADHLRDLDRELTDIATGRNDRLIVEMPPRHGKSQLCSQYFPAWYLGTYPTRNVMLLSATGRGAQRFSKSTRDIVEAHCPRYFDVGLSQDVRSWEHWKLAGSGTDQGEVFAAGLGGGGIMGAGADLIIIDDFFRNVEDALSETIREKQYEWFLSTSSTRLSPTGAIVMIATRWHRQDLIGMAKATQDADGKKWRVLSFPAINARGEALWQSQWPLSKLEEIRDKYTISGYPWMWEALYQQDPPEILDSEWPAEYFDNIYIDEWNDDHIIRTVALDPSLGKSDRSDYSAFVAVAKGRDGVYYVDANISRRASSQMVTEGVEWMRGIKPDAFGCESNAFQELLLPEFEAALPASGMPMSQVYGIHNHLPKVTRIRMLTTLLATQRIKIRRSPGSSLLVEQLKGFPSHKHDDGPDALEMAIRLCEELLSGSGSEEPQPEVMRA